MLPVTVCDKNGKQLFDAKLSNVAFVPNTPFNLVSVSNKIKNGWEVVFDKDKTWLRKNNVTNNFDIVIDTPKERLFAAQLKDQRWKRV
jgi:hypothetical protein